MKKIIVFAVTALFAAGTFSVMAQEVQPAPKQETKTIKKVKRYNASAPVQPAFEKGPYPDDPSQARSEAPTKIKKVKKVKSTPDEPKPLKTKKQKRESGTYNGMK